MHNIPNIEEVGETAAICNCCACACFGLRVGLMFGARDAVRSNYVAKVDAEKCVACGQCVENCPGNALMLGQKLCTKTPVTAMPEVKKITEHAWSKADWNVDYRENRKDVVDSGTAPCKTACPAHIAIQGYIKLAAQGKYMDALELIKKENPFPAICGRICNRRCESECTRGEVDEPIAIDEVKKFIADTERKAGNRFIPKKRYDCSDKKIAIVGAGPAGLACAYFLALDNYDITCLKKKSAWAVCSRWAFPPSALKKKWWMRRSTCSKSWA
jgi:NAD-dependent dihydropyrimidine dehydrogenase PreA subunit